ncbi:porin, partial [Salmonella enterica]|nr:porin [Salmonella enterica]
MKKKAVVFSALASAIMMISTSQAAEIYSKDGNKLDLYGKVDGLHYFSSDRSKTGDQSYIKMGFKGETQITNQLTGFGQWEYNIQANTSESKGANSWTRLAFAGLKFNNYGSLSYGRNYGVMYDVESYTDVLPEFGGNSYTNTDNFMTGRANGLATYRMSDFFGLVDGLDFALQYQGKNESQNQKKQHVVTNNHSAGSDIRYDNGDGFAISTNYDLGNGGSAGVAYSVSERTNVQKFNTTAGGDKATAWTAGLKYDENNIYLAAMYAETQNMTPYGNKNGVANKTQNVELTAQYQFDFGLRPEISYIQSKGKNLYSGYNIKSNAIGDKDLV